jgi:1-phosphatidylinositol-4-phosphate 5-kinase
MNRLDHISESEEEMSSSSSSTSDRDSENKLTPENYLIADILAGVTMAIFNKATEQNAKHFRHYIRRKDNTSDFRMKEYLPDVYCQLRELFGYAPEEIAKSFEFDPTIKMKKSAAKGGAMFIFTKDRRFIIKTLFPHEKNTLVQMSSEYLKYFQRRPHSLINRFMGVYRINRGRKPMYLVVMNNIFYKTKSLDEIYDLKGAIVNRKTKNQNLLNDPSHIRLDMDLNGKIFHIGNLKSSFDQQIKRDVKFLARYNLMDYSLLVGVHRMIEEEQLLSREATVETQKDRGRLSMFHQDEGGLLTPVIEGTTTRELYYIGIIDILQSYNAEKHVAHFFKSMKYNHKKISTVEPEFYAQRFKKFVNTVVQD